MLRKRHAATAGLVPARVLNLVVVVDSDLRGEVAGRLERVGRYHASRTIVCSVRSGRGGLDARAVLAYDEPRGAPGGSAPPGVIREQIDLGVSPDQLAELPTIIDPLLLSELPTVVWCPHGHGEARAALLSLTDVVLLDSDEGPEPEIALAAAGDLLASAQVVDLAWLRTTPWRERLAATFDPPYRRHELATIAAVEIRHRAASAASAALFAGWLTSRLDRAIEISAADADQDAPGLAGITVTSSEGFSLSLDRAPGGLVVHRRLIDGTESSWQVFGASRGEGGILGESVRQALICDPIYREALACAVETLAA